MTTENVTLQVVTPPVRLSYPKLAVPKPYRDKGGQEKGAPTYGAELIVSKADVGEFQYKHPQKEVLVDGNMLNFYSQVAKKKWPDLDLEAALSFGALQYSYVDGDKKAAAIAAEKGEKATVDHYKDSFVISSKSLQAYPPLLRLVDESGEEVVISRTGETAVEKIEELFYPGCYVVAELTLKANETTAGKYVTSYLNAIDWFKDGARIGGGGGFGSLLREARKKHRPEVSSHDPTSGMDDLDDEIPF